MERKRLNDSQSYERITGHLIGMRSVTLLREDDYIDQVMQLWNVDCIEQSNVSVRDLWVLRDDNFS